LYDAMSTVSEAAYGLRWAPGTEYGVWMLLTEPRVRWGRARGHHADVAPALTLIEALVRQAGIWIVWPPGERAPMVMALDNWRVRYATTAGRKIA
jgi:hypothetical protein